MYDICMYDICMLVWIGPISGKEQGVDGLMVGVLSYFSGLGQLVEVLYSALVYIILRCLFLIIINS